MKLKAQKAKTPKSLKPLNSIFVQAPEKAHCYLKTHPCVRIEPFLIWEAPPPLLLAVLNQGFIVGGGGY